jgi:hypothetical protein
MNFTPSVNRHSRESGNPVEKQSPALAGQHLGVVRYAEYLFLLDSRFRGNDGLKGLSL